MDLDVVKEQKELLYLSDSDNELNQKKEKDMVPDPDYNLCSDKNQNMNNDDDANDDDEDSPVDDDAEYSNTASLMKEDTYVSSDEYMSNMSEDECDTFFCNECGKKFNNGVSLKAHLAKKHNPRALATCELCFSKYRGDFIEHLNSEHSLINGAGYFCKKCESILIDYKSVLKHKHGKDIFNVCKYCNKMYKSHENYKLHLLKHNNSNHFNKNERTYTCEKCGKRVVLLSSFVKDFKFENKSSISLKCQKCREKSKTDSGRTYKCSLCNRAFSRNGDLKKHMHSHSSKSRSNLKSKEA